MIKLLICDDEPYICSLLQHFINAEQLGIQRIGFAYDGNSALEIILTQQPDIVITDIKMPGMDGLSLISQVRAQGLNTRFVIVSGFGTFDYARQAMRYQVEDYLVKPIEREAVQEVMEKLCSAIKAEQESRGQMQDTLDALEHSSLVARRYFLSSILYNPAQTTGRSLEVLNREFHMDFQPGLFQMVLVNLIPLEQQMQISDSMKRIESYLRSIFRESCLECESYMEKSSILFLLNYPADAPEEMDKRLTHYFRSMFSRPEYNAFFRMVFLFSKPYSSIGDSSKAYQEAKSLLPAGILKGYNCICAAQLPAAPVPAPAAGPAEYLGNLLQSTQLSLQSALYAYFLSQKAYILAAPSSFPQLLETVAAYVAKQAGAEAAQLQAVLLQIQDGLTGCGDLTALCALAAAALFGLLEHYAQLQAREKSLPVQAARQYIAQHYTEALTLELVAAQVFLSPSYLSALFRKELKQTFNDYVTELRVKAAKNLLAQPTYTIAQVAELVGYTDAKYFSRIFTKKVGLKPVEYRRLRAADMEAGIADFQR